MTGWLHLLTLELAVIGLAALALVWSAFVPGRAKLLGWTLALALAGLLALSFALELEGEVPGGAYVSGAWTLLLKRAFLAAGALAVLGSVDWLERCAPRRHGEYHALLLLSLTGMLLLAGVRDWVLLLVCFELMGVPLYALCAWAKDEGPAGEPRLSAEAALKLFVTGVASSGVALMGLALVIGTSGTTGFAGLVGGALQPVTAAGMLLVIAGLAFKLGAVPFHMWVPDTYQGAPTPFVAFLSVAPKLAALAALSAILLVGWGTHAALWTPALAVLAALSLLLGNLSALPQTDARRLLAYSGIAQIGFVLLALVAGTAAALGTLLFFAVSYLFTNMGAFLTLHAAAQGPQGHTLAQLSGLARRAPWLAAALLVFLLSLAGIPFVSGFWAKLFVLLEAWRAGQAALVVLAAALAVVALFYYLSLARAAYMAQGPDAQPIATPLALRTAILICLAAVILLGLVPGPLLDAARAAAASLPMTR